MYIKDNKYFIEVKKEKFTLKDIDEVGFIKEFDMSINAPTGKDISQINIKITAENGDIIFTKEQPYSQNISITNQILHEYRNPGYDSFEVLIEYGFDIAQMTNADILDQTQFKTNYTDATTISIGEGATKTIKWWKYKNKSVTEEVRSYQSTFEYSNKKEKYDVTISQHKDKTLWIVLINKESGKKVEAHMQLTKEIEHVDMVYIDDYIIITTGEKIFAGIPLIDTFTSDPTTPNNTLRIIQANSISDIASDISSEQLLTEGFNSLSSDPEKFSKDKFGVANEAYGIRHTNVNNKDNYKITLNNKYLFEPALIKKNSSTTVTGVKWTVSFLQKGSTENERVIILDEINGAHVDPNAAIYATVTKKASNIEVALKNSIGAMNISAEVTFSDNTVSVVNNLLEVENKNNDKKIKSHSNEIDKSARVRMMYGKLVFYGNGTQQIYTSSIDDPFYFPVANIVKADAYNKSERINYIADFKDIKIIFTESTMMSMSGTGSFALNEEFRILGLDGHVGAVGFNAVSNLENTVTFVSRDGIYIVQQLSVADKRVDLLKISTPINDMTIPYNNFANKTEQELQDNVDVDVVEKRIFYSYPSKGFVLVYDFDYSGIEKGKWSRWLGHKTTGDKKSINFDKMFSVGNQLYVADNINGGKLMKKRPKIDELISRLNVPDDYYKDGNELIEFTLITQSSNFGNQLTDKKFKKLFVITENNKTSAPKYEMSVIGDVSIDQNGVIYESTNIASKVASKVVNATASNKVSTNPILGSFLLGSTASGYVKSSRTESLRAIKSSNFPTLSVLIKNNSIEPFEVKEIVVEYSESRVGDIYSKKFNN